MELKTVGDIPGLSGGLLRPGRRVFQHPRQHLQLELMPSLPPSALLYPGDLQHDCAANSVWAIPIPPGKLGGIWFHTCSNLKTNTGNQLLGWEAMPV